MKTLVRVSFHREGIHSWADAPEAQSWLRFPHLHEFKVTVSIQVFGLDRELEFYAVRDRLTERFAEQVAQGGACEQMALSLLDFVHRTYPGRWASVTVAEDENFAATVEDG